MNAPIVDKMRHIRAMQAAMRGKQIYKEGQSEFVGGGKWEIVTKFKGKSHEQGGIDLEVNDGYVRHISGMDDADDIAKNGRFWRSFGATAYGIGEGLLDTITLGATDQLTDIGYTALQNVGGSSADERREQNSLRGYGTTAGAITGAVLTGGATTGSAIQQGAKGVGAGVSQGSPDSKFAQGVGTYLPLAGSIAGMAVGNAGYGGDIKAATEGAKAAKEAGDLTKAAELTSKAQRLTKLSNFASSANKVGRAAEIARAFYPLQGAAQMPMYSPVSSGTGASNLGMFMQGLGPMGGMRDMGAAMTKIAGRGYQDDTTQSYSGVAPGGDIFHAQVPMREETLAQLARYNINV
jgi:hypothetical protein